MRFRSLPNGISSFFHLRRSDFSRDRKKIIINSAWQGRIGTCARASGRSTASFPISGHALSSLFIFQFPFPLLIGSGACVKNYANDIYYVAERASEREGRCLNFHLLRARLMQFAAVGKWDYSKTAERAHGDKFDFDWVQITAAALLKNLALHSDTHSARLQITLHESSGLA